MATMVCMPAVSANAKDAVLVEWTVSEGDAVRGGDSLGGIETDKAVVDLEAEHDGVVGRLLVAAGTRVDVGAPMAILLRDGETADDAASLLDERAVARPASAPGDGGARTASPGVSASNDPAVPAPPAEASAHTDSRILASPLARKMARQADVALTDLQGSGPDGRIIKRDVERALAGIAPNAAPASTGTASGYDVVPHTPMRLAIARRLTESKTTIPHFYLRGLCRADALLALRTQFNAVAARKLSINDLVVRAAACALRDVPDMNVTWAPEGLRRYRHADIAIAVATQGGLITPIVRAADRLPVAAIADATSALIERARGGTLAPADYEGGSFGISNLGMHGVSDFAAIINPPQSAMLAVGAVTKEPVADADAVRTAAVMRYTLAVDHRAIDGALAAAWMARFTWYLEQPVAMLV
jgi:pyruvate dehydrogenase E2 component (dihydrolipoamide acetyltransferase)